MIAHALRQLLREARVTAVLLAAITLVTAFAALAPLYVRMVSSAELDTQLTRLEPRQQRFEISNDAPLPADLFAPLQNDLAEIVTSTHRYAQTVARHCGLSTDDGLAPPYLPCYRQFLYDDLTTAFTLVDGRFSQPNDDVLEFVLTAETIDKAMSLSEAMPLTVGRVYVLTDGRAVTRAELVGIVTSNIPQGSAHWDGQISVHGQIIPIIGNAPTEFDMALLVHPDVFQTAFDARADRAYVMRVQLDLTQLKSSQLNAVESRLNTAIADVRRQYPEAEIFSPVSTLLASFQARVAEVMQPVILLVALTMLLLLYTLVTTGSLILDRSRTGWAQMAGRGGSARQLVLMHLISMGTLGLLAWLMSVPLAFVFAVALAALGPQAGIINFPQATDLPLDAFLFGGAAALLAIVALVLPGVPAAFTSFARLKSESGRPVSRPLWARYFLDVILTVLGIVFVVRARGLTDITDPFSLAGPALLLTGAALLWLRVFPLLMRLAGAVFGTLNRLSVRLAFWGLERDPGTYGQLVMLVVGTLALGTASLALTQTRADGAWDTAYRQLNADAVLTVVPTAIDAAYDYTQIDGVNSASPVMLIDSVSGTGSLRAAIIGYTDPDTPEIAALADAEFAFSGLVLPDDAAVIAVEAYGEMPLSAAGEAPVQTRITLDIINGDQIHVDLPMTTADENIDAQWMTYTAALDPALLGRPLYRFAGIRFPSTQQTASGPYGDDGRFDHTIYIDGLRTETSDGGQTPLLTPDMTLTSVFTRPVASADMRSSVLTYGPTSDVLTPDGRQPMRVLYNRNISLANRVPTLEFLRVDQVLPVLVSPALADSIGSASRLRRPLQIGDSLLSEFPADRNDDTVRLRLEYVVVGFVTPPAPYGPNAPVLMTRMDWLQTQANQSLRSRDRAYGINRINLQLVERQPSEALRSALAAIPGVTQVDFAYDRFAAFQRAPLANAVTGMLFAGFCAAFGLIVLQAGFYTAVMLRRRATSFAVLRSLGWGSGNILQMLAIEQAAVVLPALVIGVVVGTGLAVLLAPLMTTDVALLRVPLLQVAGLLAVVAVLFVALLVWAANTLRSADITTHMRTVE